MGDLNLYTIEIGHRFNYRVKGYAALNKASRKMHQRTEGTVEAIVALLEEATEAFLRGGKEVSSFYPGTL